MKRLDVSFWKSDLIHSHWPVGLDKARFLGSVLDPAPQGQSHRKCLTDTLSFHV